MTEKELLKKSGFYTSFILFGISLFWFLFYIQTSFGGYAGGPASGIDVGINSRSTTQSNWQVGSSGVYVLRLGIENVTGSGSSGYMSGTNTYYPRIEWTPTLGTFNFVGTGSYPVTVQTNGVAIPSASSVNGKIDIVGGTGTTNVFTDTTLAGLGTITASFGANGLVISPSEYSSVNNATGELQSQITTAAGSITSHAHTGSDGTTQVSHTNLTNKGTQTHVQIDSFIAREAVASGLATLDANSKVVQNPASGTSTPGASKTVMSDGTSKILDGWLSDNVTKMGTPTTDNISEGSTNKYYTDEKVNVTIGSSSITSPQVSPKITFTSPAIGQFLKIVDSQGNVENGTSSASVDFSAVIGSASASQLPTDPVISSNWFVAGVVGGTTTGALKIPTGTDAQRPGTPTVGMIRINSAVGSSITGGTISASPSTNTGLEVFIGNSWQSVSSVYTYHTFTSSGSFVVSGGTKTVQVLVVAGGGGGGYDGSTGSSGGGGAGGGVVYNGAYEAYGTVTVTIGAGGASRADGNNSIFGTITATGGGKGGDWNTNGSAGGSGGGGGGSSGATTTGGDGSGTSGYAGGGNAGFITANYPSGGGGGAGAVGSNASSASICGSGGVGTFTTFPSGTYYAGGGGGGLRTSGTSGTGGTGGGGNGYVETTGGSTGTANTGGGGGGGGGGAAAGLAGGSGIVIIRYIQ